MSYSVELTEGAHADLDRLTTALAGRWPEGSRRIIPRFHAALPRLESFPLACGLAYESRFSPQEVRHLLFDVRKGFTFRALFTVQGDCVRVLAVRAPARSRSGPRTFSAQPIR
jgi:hypothetical protein